MNNKLKSLFLKNWPYLLIAILIIMLTATVLWVGMKSSELYVLRQSSNSRQSPTDPTALLEEHGITPLTSEQSSQNSATTEDLIYIIEEEKLAHDVYVALYEKWGLRTFNNIQNSETTHQNMALGVIESRGLTDPRKRDTGQFTNKDLQLLYDKLVAQGSQSVTEAYKVGVTIEELDISDIQKMLSRLDPKDTDIKNVLENLMSGSENHLRAFNRKL